VTNLRLQYLVLHNIGPFRGRQIIDLNTDKSDTGYAFFAANGRGKTSIYNAMRWCLFGEVKTRVRAGSGSKIKPKIRPITGEEEDEPLMNSSAYEEDRIPEMSVILMAEGSQGKIQITRDVKVHRAGKRRDDNLIESLLVQLGDDTETGQDAEEMIQKFFPSSLQQFFFIDGEALEEYQSMIEQDDIQGLKDDVEAVLRLPSITRGLEDLVSIKRKIQSNIETVNKLSQKAVKARDEAEQFRIQMEVAQREVEYARGQISKVQEDLDVVNAEIEKHGEMAEIVNQKRELELRLEATNAALIRSAEHRIKMSAESWKLLIWKQAEPLYLYYENQITTANQVDWEIKTAQSKLDRLNEEYKRMDGICAKCGQKVPDIEKHMKEIKVEIKQSQDKLKHLNSGSIMQVDELNIRLGSLTSLKPQRGDLERAKAAEEAWLIDKSSVESLAEKLKKINAKVTEKATTELGELGTKRGSKEQLLRTLNVKLKNVMKDAAEKERSFENADSKSGLSNSSLPSKDNQTNSIIIKLIKTIQNTIESYRKVARRDVEQAASKVFMEVTNATEVYNGISLDDNFRAKIRLKNGKFDVAPSSGTKSIMTISIIDGLRQVSGLEAPIFFDTPGRSLDEKHKQAMLEYFWKEKGQQFLIFAHSGEYKVDETMRDFGPKIAKAWELWWPRDYTYCLKCKSQEIIRHKDGNGENIRGECMNCNHEWDNTLKNTTILEVKK